jgi:hypothetical protein
MANHWIFAAEFEKLYGQPCWNVSPGWGSFLTLNFGQPCLEVREPTEPKDSCSPRVRKLLQRRRVTVRGQWRLWIYCCDWRVLENNKVVGDCSSGRRIKRAAGTLDGQRLIQTEIISRGCRTVFHFDLGGRLETKPYNRRSEQWMLFEPTGNVLTLRADKCLCYSRSDAPCDTLKWEPIEQR